MKVDGAVIKTPAFNVSSANRISVNGKLLAAPEPLRLWLYNKPKGLLTTHRDPGGRPTVFENLPKDMPRVISVGRLDFNSEGLLLLTTSGTLARHLELPATGWIRRYRVRAFGRISPESIEKLEKGVTIDGVRYAPAKIAVEKSEGTNKWYMVTLKEGKNREVRRLFEYVDGTVNRLIRVDYGPFKLGDVPVGQVREVPMFTLKKWLPKELLG